jgi:DNA mismatch endonuclease (patch repair protein)
MDKITTAQRSANMSKIHAKNTKPEMAVRRLLHRLGYRFRIHSSFLPGKPDIYFTGRNLAIFVHGCFWHQHAGCKHAVLPKTRTEFWIPKLRGNQERDRQNIEQLDAMGWKTLVIWECETKRAEELGSRVIGTLGSTKYMVEAHHSPRERDDHGARDNKKNPPSVTEIPADDETSPR